MVRCTGIIETTRAKLKGGLRMTIRAEISNVVAVKSTFHILPSTRISSRSIMVSLNLEPPLASICPEEAEEGPERLRAIKGRNMKRWTWIIMISTTLTMKEKMGSEAVGLLKRNYN